MTLGEKIRARRIELKLKQSDIGGDAVTKNMICRIEKGACSPSLATLSSIATALSVPMTYLLSDKDNLEEVLAEEILPSVRNAFEEKRYLDVLTLISKNIGNKTHGELAMLGAEACLYLAERSLFHGNFKEIHSYLSRCLAYCAQTISNTDWIKARIELCRAISDNPQTPKWEINRDLYLSLTDQAIGYNRFLYITDEKDLAQSNPHFITHMKAKDLISTNHFQDALSILLSIEEEKTSGNLDPYFLYRIYSDTETCYKELRDYENAYRYSTKRISLLNEFMN